MLADLILLSKDSNQVHPPTDPCHSEADNRHSEADNRQDARSTRPSKKGRSKLVSRILSPAVRLWLRSQLLHVGYLQVKIDSSDRQLLKGSIPKVSLVARAAIYQGLHLTEVRVAATDIKINLGQVLRGKPLRILAPFPISCELQLAEADLNASFDSPILANAVIDFLRPLLLRLPQAGCLFYEELGANIISTINLKEARTVMAPGILTLFGTVSSPNCSHKSLLIRTALELSSPRELIFHIRDWKLSSTENSLPVENIKIDLGSEVEIEQLTLTSETLFVKGQLTVKP